jgi:hypothetical protein
MKVTCIKNFVYEESIYLKNMKYELIDYENIFYVAVPNDGPLSAYPIDLKYRDNFVTLKELRKLKLKKINLK